MIFSMSLSLFLISLVVLLSALDYRVLSSAILAFLTHILTLFSEHLQGVATPLLITVILSAPFLHFLTLSMYVLLLSLSLEILSCLLSPLSFLTSILTVFSSALELLRVSILRLTAAIYSVLSTVFVWMAILWTCLATTTYDFHSLIFSSEQVIFVLDSLLLTVITPLVDLMHLLILLLIYLVSI